MFQANGFRRVHLACKERKKKLWPRKEPRSDDRMFLIDTTEMDQKFVGSSYHKQLQEDLQLDWNLNQEILVSEPTTRWLPRPDYSNPAQELCIP